MRFMSMYTSQVRPTSTKNEFCAFINTLIKRSDEISLVEWLLSIPLLFVFDLYI